MNVTQFAFIGIKGSGKTSLIEKLQQKKEMETEQFNVYSFKQGASLIYMTDAPYDLSNPKSFLTLMYEADACVFCVSALEQIGQQLGELILLINYVGLTKGVIAITKSESTTPDEIEVLKTKLKAILSQSTLKEFEFVSVSSHTEIGISELIEEMIKIKSRARDSSKPFKMGVEFSKEIKSGFTTLFGVIECGTIKKYDKVFMMPWGKEFITQEINLHGEVVERAKAGDRVGISYKGLYPWDVQTGDIVTANSKFHKAKKIQIAFEINNFFKDELRSGAEVQLNVGIQTFPATILKILKEGSEVQSAKPGDKVTIEAETKLPFAFETGQNAVIINPGAHWRSIKVVGAGKVEKGLG
jgi:selenocysteine-specific translation elongation factor